MTNGVSVFRWTVNVRAVVLGGIVLAIAFASAVDSHAAQYAPHDAGTANSQEERVQDVDAFQTPLVRYGSPGSMDRGKNVAGFAGAPSHIRHLPAVADAAFPYRQFLHEAQAGVTGKSNMQMLPDFLPWWGATVSHRQRLQSQPYPISLDTVILNALAYSSYVRTVSDDVLIRETGIIEAEAAFDVQQYIDTKFARDSAPIGSLLDTGGPPRLRNLDWRFSAGLRKRTPLGGSWDLSQKIGMRDSNSRFFVPNQQGNSRLSLRTCFEID